MLRGMFLALLCLAALPVNGGRADGETGREGDGRGVLMRVLWTVSGYVLPADAAWTEEQAGIMLFKPLDMDESSIMFDGRTCQDVTFERREIRVSEFLGDHSVRTDALIDIKDQMATLITTDCSLPGFDAFLRLPDKRLLVLIQGGVFFLSPAISY